MFKKGQKSYSIVKGKCPRCHEGDFFKYPTTINPKKITQIHKNCPNCDLKYMIEPSFFYGAMYVNYGLTVAISVAAFIIAKIFIDLSLAWSFISIGIILVLMAPINLRLARIIWINMFVNFDEKFLRNNSTKTD